jgi:hypothetical protein
MAMKEATMTEAGTTKSRRPLTPRQRRYRFALGFAGVLGGIIGAWMAADQPAGSNSFWMAFSGPLSPGFAIGSSLAWILGLTISIILYHRAIDDHEERAWLWAGLAGWYAFVFPAPLWWVLHRADLAPPVDAMLLFLFSMAVNAIVWMWLKYR